ncbi:MAG: heme A synthase [Flavobacteriales bacterium]|nr:heme A synthase [Flavobacteriales bacterium]
MEFSKLFVRFNWVTLVLIYLVVVAGSFVRISGSGMGCPDWPKCFGQWVPPTEVSELPPDYREAYLLKRQKKVEKFCKFLNAIGLKSTAERIKNDPTVYVEEAFNTRKTWTEYVNRLVGFLAGNFMLFGFLWIILKYRKHKIFWLTALNLVLLLIEAWFGSIVVATNLVPWTITVHLFLALVIIALQLYIIRIISPVQQRNLPIEKSIRILVFVVFAITFYQMFLGTQVREYIDELTKQGFGRETWTDKLGLPFYIHRSFSWLVLILLAFIAWKNEKTQHYLILRSSFVILVLELVSGVLLAYADMPGLVQTAHLVFATILFGNLWMATLRMKRLS